MPSQRQIGRDWNVAHSWVAACVKRGCPTDSYEAARSWKQANIRQRALTHPKSFARRERREVDTYISLAKAKEIAFGGYDLILDLVDALPQAVAEQCNPENPQLALSVLEAETTFICCRSYEAYALWRREITTLESKSEEKPNKALRRRIDVRDILRSR
jgi:hypothetical protein